MIIINRSIHYLHTENHNHSPNPTIKTNNFFNMMNSKKILQIIIVILCRVLDNGDDGGVLRQVTTKLYKPYNKNK